jgi:hypothetical protein
LDCNEFVPVAVFELPVVFDNSDFSPTEHLKHIKSYHFVSKCMILYDFVCTFLVIKNTIIWCFYITKNFYIINTSLLYKKPLTKSYILIQNDMIC